MRAIAALIISILLAGCTNATKPVYEELPDDTTEEGLVGIDYLKTLATGRSTTIDKDILIEGYVIANDFRNEFYKKIVIDDGRGGIEIDIDRRQLYQLIPLHAYIQVSCNGLALGRSGGKFTLGAPPTGEYATDRIAAAEISRYIKLTDEFMMPEPTETTVDGLAVEHISRYVCIRNLRVTDEEAGLSWCSLTGYEDDDGDEDDIYLTYTDRHFTDDEGHILTVRTLNRCDYGNERMPLYPVSLAGIIDYADDRYIMRISNHRITAE